MRKRYNYTLTNNVTGEVFRGSTMKEIAEMAYLSEGYVKMLMCGVKKPKTYTLSRE